MNKDEMIENIADYIQIASDLYRIECIKVAKYLVENKNCRIIADDEIVIKKSEYEKLSKDYATINNEAYYCGLNVGKQETAREILQEFFKTFVVYACVGDYYTATEIYNKIQALANELGIELENKNNDDK